MNMSKNSNLKHIIGCSDRNQIVKQLDEALQEMIPISHIVEDPDGIEKNDIGKIEINQGEHHGKWFVESIYEKLSIDKFLRFFVKRVNSSGFEPKRRGNILIRSKKGFPNHYVTQLISYEDQGYAVEIEFITKTKWKVILLSKLLRFRMKEFRKAIIKVSDEESQYVGRTTVADS
ncbi:MAG: hypothetical protein Q8O10_09490 [candidate division Zixibacteria bacterium]|nr:hypothetical protein [candidate division Zixibacteria bacterium]